jgi:hypothetical protein
MNKGWYIVIFFVTFFIALLVLFYLFKDRKKDGYTSSEQRPVIVESGGGYNDRYLNPILNYYWNYQKGINPATLGDPIRISTNNFGPVNNDTNENSYSQYVRKGGNTYNYMGGNEGFVDGRNPIQSSTLNETNEQNHKAFYIADDRGVGVLPQVGSYNDRPYSNNIPFDVYQNRYGSKKNIHDYERNVSGMLNVQRPNTSQDFLRPYERSDNLSNVDFFNNRSVSLPFISSVDKFLPAASVNTAFEKVGLLISNDGHHYHGLSNKDDDEKNYHNDEAMMNLYRRPIAPLQDLWEYQVQDKDGFVIPLEGRNYLEDGDIVDHVIGKGRRSWKVRMFMNNKYIWK